MRVELGAGSRPAFGFVALDANPDVGPDIVASLLDLPFADASIEALRAVDAAEHVPYRLTDRLFAEWARVLQPGGVLFVQVPAFDEICRWLVESPELLTVPADLPQTPIMGAVWRIFGGGADGTYVDRAGDPRWNSHYTGFSEESLRGALEAVGFVVDRCDRNGHPNYQCLAHRALAV